MTEIKKYFVTYNEEDYEEYDWNEISSIIEEQFNGMKTRGEQQDIKDEIYELEIGEAYEYFNEYKNVVGLRVERIA